MLRPWGLTVPLRLAEKLATLVAGLVVTGRSHLWLICMRFLAALEWLSYVYDQQSRAKAVHEWVRQISLDLASSSRSNLNLLRCGSRLGKRFIVRTDEMLTAFLELKRAIHEFAVSLMLKI